MKLKNLNPSPLLNEEQVMLAGLFGSGGRALTPEFDSRPPVVINGALMPNKFEGYPIDPEKKTTADFFGFGITKMFGYPSETQRLLF